MAGGKKPYSRENNREQLIKLLTDISLGGQFDWTKAGEEAGNLRKICRNDTALPQ